MLTPKPLTLLHGGNLARIPMVLALLVLPLFSAIGAEEPQPTRPLRDLNKSYFPFTPVQSAAEWKTRREEIQRRALVACGLYPLPEKTPLNTVIHGRIEKDDYTVDRVFFESIPGHFVTGSLYLPKNFKGKIPGIITPHGHWANGRFMNESDDEVKKQIAMGAEKFENAARSPLQARCVQLARMGCAVFFYDMLGYADSIQFPEHRHGATKDGFVSADAELNLVSYFGLQTWNSIRAIDFLTTLPYVDTKRIGCTGASGGGTQTMLAAGIDNRIAAAFPCVMVSTAMQGGCTCENAHYLRINQGNVDLAALTAPRPLGMTAADDWTKELETKGYPDLKNLYAMLKVPDRVEAHFDIQFPHNFNGVSGKHMYDFFKRYFKLDGASTDERDFELLSKAEATVWTEQHPRPAGNQAGAAHERAVIAWFKQQSEQTIAPLLQPRNKTALRKSRETLGGALEILVGRNFSQVGETTLGPAAKPEASALIRRGIMKRGPESVETILLLPKDWNHETIVWLSLKGEASILNSEGMPTPATHRLLDRGYAIACPELYMPGAMSNPNVYAPGTRRSGGNYEGFSGYHYGYNPTLFAERVRDVLTALNQGRDDRLIVVGLEGAGAIAAAAAALAPGVVDQLICDTEGFRFGNLTDVWDANFVPGAVKYGDLPGMLSLCAPVRTMLINETPASVPGVVQTFKAAKGKLSFAAAGKDATAAILEVLTANK